MLKRLIVTVVIVLVAMLAVTAVFDLVGNVLLRPYANAIVENQLSANNAAPTATLWYFKAGRVLYLLVELALLSVAVKAGIRFWKVKKGKE